MIIFRLVFIILIFGSAAAMRAQSDPRIPQLDSRVSHVQSRVDTLERRIDDSAAGLVLILFGAFCALWAQNTGRSAWLWFFLGFFFSVITVFVLLWKNSGDIDRRNRRLRAQVHS